MDLQVIAAVHVTTTTTLLLVVAVVVEVVIFTSTWKGLMKRLSTLI